MHDELQPDWLNEPSDVNAIDENVWPRHMVRASSGEVEIAGVAARSLVAEFGTPLYVIDEDDFRARATGVKKIFETAAASIGTTAKVYYAGKVFLCTEVAAWVNELGLNIDVSTSGEFAAAIAGGVPAERIGYHGNNKSTREIARAVSAGVGAIVIDSEAEIERIAAAAAAQGVVQKVRLRVNTGVHANTHDYLATAREDQKFGVSMTDAIDLVARIREYSHLEFLGVHSHIGSQIYSSDGFVEAVRRTVKLHAELSNHGPVPELNLGGGFGVNYKPGDEAPLVTEFAEAIAVAVKVECHKHQIQVPALAFEPGRYIAANPGVTLYTVGTIKDVHLADHDATRKYVSVDGGMSDNARTALYAADYHTRIVSRSSEAAPALARVVGKHCESGDIVVRFDYLPADVTSGDILAVAATGAYCYSLSSNYNMLTKPAVVAVRSGSARTLIRAETEADLFARDVRYQANGNG
ncbi:MAG: diaminopimelate decarboxylase [Micrococcales bacterium]